MINHIKIERLRGIKTCALEDFGRFNIFLGHNNCGKTTVLEALYLYLGHNNIIGNININNLQQLVVDNEDRYKVNFYNRVFNLMYPDSVSFSSRFSFS